MDIETWKNQLKVLVCEFEKELALQKENETIYSIKLSNLLYQIMMHYIGEDNLKMIFDEVCFMEMNPLTSCEIGFDQYGMTVRRKKEKGYFEIILMNILNNGQYRYPFGRFYSVRYMEVPNNYANFDNKVLNMFSNPGDVVCGFHNKTFDVQRGPEEHSWIVSQLSRVNKEDLIRDDSLWSIRLKSYGIKKENNKLVRDYFSISDDVQLYKFNCEIKSLSKQKELDDSSKKM